MAVTPNRYASLARSMPVADEEAARAAEQTRQIQLRAQLAQAQPGMTMAQAGQVAGAAAAQQGQAQVQQAARTAQAQTQLGGMGLQAEAQAAQQALQQRSLNLQKQANSNANKLAGLGEGVKDQVLRGREDYNMGQANQKYLNQRQMADYAVKSAKSKQEYQDTMQMVQQTQQREMALMERQYQILKQAIDQEGREGRKKLDQETREQLYTNAAALKKKMDARASELANNTAMWQAGGTIVGAVIGGIYGGAPGAMAGGAIGGGAGTAAAGAQAD